jgi:hypothetical protein
MLLRSSASFDLACRQPFECTSESTDLDGQNLTEEREFGNFQHSLRPAWKKYPSYLRQIDRRGTGIGLGDHATFQNRHKGVLVSPQLRACSLLGRSVERTSAPSLTLT